MKLVRGLAVLVFFYLANAVTTSAWGFTAGPPVDERSILPSRELEFATEKAVARAPAVHEKAREFVRSLDTAPSCMRSAAFGLIKDCSSLESKASKRHGVLDSVKTLYAARLAVCELREAGLGVPAACTSEMLERGAGGFPTMKLDPKKGVANCVKALESRPQSWTSYSNSRQNALLICQAARPEAEREDMINMFKSLLENNEASEETLAQQVLFSKQQLAEQRVLATELQSFSTAMSTEIKAGLEAALDTFDRLQSRASAAEAEVIEMFTGIANQAKGDMQLLFETILQHKAKIQDASTDIATVVSSLVEEGAAVSTGWRDSVDKQSQDAIQVHKSLAGLITKHDSLEYRLQQMYGEIESFTGAQRQAQEELQIGSSETLAAFTALNASAVSITAALEGLSVYAGFFSSLATSTETILKWTAWTVLAVLVVVSSVLGGRRGLVTSTCVGLIFVCGTSAAFQTRVRQALPLGFTNIDLSNDNLVRHLNILIAVAMIICLAASSRRSFASFERRFMSRWAQDQEDPSTYHSSLPRFSVSGKQRELTIHYYDPLTDDFKLNTPS